MVPDLAFVMLFPLVYFVIQVDDEEKTLASFHVFFFFILTISLSLTLFIHIDKFHANCAQANSDFIALKCSFVVGIFIRKLCTIHQLLDSDCLHSTVCL